MGEDCSPAPSKVLGDGVQEPVDYKTNRDNVVLEGIGMKKREQLSKVIELKEE